MIQLRKLVSMAITAVFLITGVMVPAQAAMITTNKISTHTEMQARKAQVAQFFARADVQQQLLDSGVSTEEVNARLDTLSAAELTMLSERIDEMPAGGTDALGVIVFVFVVLLITDIMGFTNIFPFVKKRH